MKTRILICLAALTASVLAKDWTRFRGPQGTGVSDAKIPAQITREHYRWDVELPGGGHSSPVLWGGKLFTTCVDRDRDGVRMVVCLDADSGKQLWAHEAKFRVYKQHRFNSYAASTPTVDSNRVYVAWTTPEDGVVAFALGHDGVAAWERKLGGFHAQHGSSSSPALIDGVLLIGNDNEGEKSFLAGLDPATGKLLWKKERADKQERAAYGTPVPMRMENGRTVALFSSTAQGVTAVDPKSGNTVWSFDEPFDHRCVSSPVVMGDLVFASAGQGGGGEQSVVVKPGGGGKAKLLYDIGSRLPYVPTPVYHDGLLYLWNDGGIVSCHEAKSGESLWSERATDGTYASPICIGGRIYGCSREGEMVVLAAGREFKLLGKHKFSGPINATPAVSGGRMFVRTTERVICIGPPK